MATGIRSWSTTAATNATADSNILWSEGQAPSTVNDSARYMMKVIADHMLLTDFGTVSGGTVGGSASVITLTCSPAVSALAAGQRYAFIFGSATTGATTLTVDSTSAGALQWRGQALIANDYAIGDWGLFICDGTNFQAVIPPRLSSQATDWTTDSTGGATADFVAFFDASQSNAANKVLVTDFFANVLANITAKALPVPADTFMLADSAASGAAKIATLQHLFDSVTGITEDATGAVGDFVLTNDISASNVAKKVALSTIQVLFAASQAQMETGTSNLVYVTPGTMKFHAGVAKAMAVFSLNGGSVTQRRYYNVTSVTRSAAGKFTVNFTTAFSDAFYAPAGVVEDDTSAGDSFLGRANGATKSTTACALIANNGGGAGDADEVAVTFHGDF